MTSLARSLPFALLLATATASAWAPFFAQAASPLEVDSSKSVEELFEKALAHHRAGEHRQALALVSTIQEKKPSRIRFGDENIHNFKGSCLTALRYFQHARKEFKKALTTQPESFDMKYNLAEMDFLQEHFIEARAKFSDLLKSTDRGRLYSEFLEFKIGMCLLMEGETERLTERLTVHARHTPTRIFLDTALAFREEKTDKAAGLLTLAREKVNEGDFALYEDSLIECGLLAPPRLTSAERRELDAAMRRPISLGIDRVRPTAPPEPEPEPVPVTPAVAPPADQS